ncbi:MAG TPA: hypothetical protein VLC93_07095 [Myxococcota bacterium]|nr:hypothetical protein [Myxococcota bacterium]
MTLRRSEPTVIPVAATGPVHELTNLAVNDQGDQVEGRRSSLVHRPPRDRSRLPTPRLAGGAAEPLATDNIIAAQALSQAAELLGVDVAEMPRLITMLRASLVARSASLDILIAEGDKLGLTPHDALATLIATSLPERFASVAEFARRAPNGQAQATLSMYVTALLSTQLARTMPPREALRVAAIASGRLTHLSPEDIFLVSVAVPTLIDGMGRAGRIEASTTVAALVHAAPELLARVTRENRETRLLIEARAMAERWHDPNEPDARGLAIAAAFVLLASSPTPEQARALFERAHLAVGSAAPRIILSSAADEERDDDIDVRLTSTLDRLEPFLDNYDRLRAQLVTVNAVPRAELCNALHGQLTRGSEQFYLALLSLLRRHQAFATRPGTRALRTALEDRDTWDRLAVA